MEDKKLSISVVLLNPCRSCCKTGFLPFGAFNCRIVDATIMGIMMNLSIGGEFNLP